MAYDARERVDIRVEGEHVEAMLRALEAALDPSSLIAFLYGPAAELFQTRAEYRFLREGDDASGKWRPLRYPTGLIRDDLGFPPWHPINERTGELKNFLLTSRGEAFWFMDGATLVWPGDPTTDSIEDKLRVAQRGSKPGENKLFPAGSTPPRPVVAANALDLLAILEGLDRWLVMFMQIEGFDPL